MIKNLLILPNQLFREEIIELNSKINLEQIIIYEHPEYFLKYKYNKKKIFLHRASMRNLYFDLKSHFESKKVKVKYLNFYSDLDDELKYLRELELFDPANKSIKSEIVKLAFDNSLKLKILESPNFISTMELNQKYFAENSYYHFDYYKMQRKRLDILLDEDGKPEGGSWSYDEKNRKKFPKHIEIPEQLNFKNEYYKETADYVEKHFADNPGNLRNFSYPINSEQAEKLLQEFLENKFADFGPYQDAFEEDIVFGYHSLLSSSLNIGLLSPEKVTADILDFYRNNEELEIASVEGFIRQIIGWREYVRALYELESESMFENDFFEHRRSLPLCFYEGSSSIKPFDDSVKKAVDHAYTHHIERLMVLGNFFLLTEINKDEVYRWFMELFIDAYEWVMVPNVYGMSQFSYTEMMTKPYISSSNYILKMSHYQKDEWAEIWDGLYWRFLSENRNKLENNPRMRLMYSILERMDDSKLAEHIKAAEDFLESI